MMQLIVSKWCYQDMLLSIVWTLSDRLVKVWRFFGVVISKDLVFVVLSEDQLLSVQG